MGNGHPHNEDKLINVLSALVLSCLIGILLIIGVVTVFRWLF